MANKPRQKMPVAERAKQFIPFAALKGLPEALQNKESSPVPRIELSEEQAALLNRKLLALAPGMAVTVIFYRAGQYRKLHGTVTRIDSAYRYLKLDTQQIAFDDLLDITSA